LSSGLGSAFFDYDSVEVHERADEFTFLANRPQSDWAKILDYTEMRRFSADEPIISAGTVDRAVYLLIEGTIGVRLGDAAGRMFKAIDAPSVLGEVAFLDGKPRSATLFAITDGELLRLRMESFEVLSAREPELGRAILLDLARIVTARLRLASDVIAHAGG
jgi:CRP/FNR family transcriptional regulator, cyclic AMP receptor protein